MAEAVSKIGIISCSGEEIPEGDDCAAGGSPCWEGCAAADGHLDVAAISWPARWASGGFASEHPTITVDGCNKSCGSAEPRSIAARRVRCWS